MRVAAVTCIAAVLFSLPAGLAHEGHDHDDSAKAALAASTFPSVAAQSELYGVVGILKNARLTVYLDQFGSNQPVTNAKMTVTLGDSDPIDAEPTEIGTYTVALPRLTGTGPFEVIFNVTSDGGDDLLAGSITLAEGTANAAIPVMDTSWPNWIAAIPAPIRNPIVLSVAIFGVAEDLFAIARGVQAEIARRNQSGRNPLLFTQSRADAQVALEQIAVDQSWSAARIAKANLVNDWRGRSDFDVDLNAFENAIGVIKGKQFNAAVAVLDARFRVSVAFGSFHREYDTLGRPSGRHKRNTRGEMGR